MALLDVVAAQRRSAGATSRRAAPRSGAVAASAAEADAPAAARTRRRLSLSRSALRFVRADSLDVREEGAIPERMALACNSSTRPPSVPPGRRPCRSPPSATSRRRRPPSPTRRTSRAASRRHRLAEVDRLLDVGAAEHQLLVVAVRLVVLGEAEAAEQAAQVVSGNCDDAGRYPQAKPRRRPRAPCCRRRPVDSSSRRSRRLAGLDEEHERQQAAILGG